MAGEELRNVGQPKQPEPHTSTSQRNVEGLWLQAFLSRRKRPEGLEVFHV